MPYFDDAGYNQERHSYKTFLARDDILLYAPDWLPQGTRVRLGMRYQLWDRAHRQLKAAVSDEDTRERNGETTSQNNELKGGGVVVRSQLALSISYLTNSHWRLNR